MEDFQTGEPRQYKNLSKAEERALRKEYRRVTPNFKIMLAVNIFFVAAFMAVAVVAIYYTIRWLLFYEDSMLIAFIMQAITGFGGFIYNLSPFAMQHFNGYWKWLWNEKNILTSEWPKKQVNAEVLSKPKFYDELSGEEKRALYKEFSAVKRGIKAWRLTSVFFIVLALANFALSVSDLIRFLFFDLDTFGISFVFIPVAVAGFFFIKITLIYHPFYNWLEYEKNIVKRKKKQ